jgi:hypothetical protein
MADFNVGEEIVYGDGERAVILAVNMGGILHCHSLKGMSEFDLSVLDIERKTGRVLDISDPAFHSPDSLGLETRICVKCGDTFTEVNGSSHDHCEFCRSESALNELFPTEDPCIEYGWISDEHNNYVPVCAQCTKIECYRVGNKEIGGVMYTRTNCADFEHTDECTFTPDGFCVSCANGDNRCDEMKNKDEGPTCPDFPNRCDDCTIKNPGCYKFIDEDPCDVCKADNNDICRLGEHFCTWDKSKGAPPCKGYKVKACSDCIHDEFFSCLIGRC